MSPECLETSRRKTRAPEHSQLKLRLSVGDVWLLKQQRASVASWNAGGVGWVWCPAWLCDSCPEAAGCIQLCSEAGAEQLLTPLLAWACHPALTGSGHSLTHPVPPVQELPLLTCLRLPLGCVQRAPGKPLNTHPAEGLCLPPLPWGHPLMLCLGNCCRSRLGMSRNVTQMPQKVVLPLKSKAHSRAGGCCLHTEGGNVGAVGRRLDCSQLLSWGPCELEICFSSLCATLCWPEHCRPSFQWQQDVCWASGLPLVSWHLSPTVLSSRSRKIELGCGADHWDELPQQILCLNTKAAQVCLPLTVTCCLPAAIKGIPGWI